MQTRFEQYSAKGNPRASDRWIRCARGMSTENMLSQILEVLTPDQGYLMFFNNRGWTVSPTLPACVLIKPIHFMSTNSFLLNVRPLFLVLLTYFERYLIDVTVIWQYSTISKITVCPRKIGTGGTGGISNHDNETHRDSDSVFYSLMWVLQNESTLPARFSAHAPQLSLSPSHYFLSDLVENTTSKSLLGY
jgi:hypothetical protein